ncbi:Putative septation protein spoVG [Clostridioides difficile]|nr:Putative septation protein spoVG [Clostridioides difficile]
MPSRKTPTGEFKDIAHPIVMDSREKIQNEILSAYAKAIEEQDVEEE